MSAGRAPRTATRDSNSVDPTRFNSDFAWADESDTTRLQGPNVIDPQSTFTLIAEVAIALAGFAGVATAFGGRDRAYEPIETARLRSLFSHAFLALAISLFVISLRSFGLEEVDSYFWSSCIGALVQAPLTCYFSIMVWRYAIDPTASTSWGGVAITTGATSACLLLLTASAVNGGSLGLLVSALSTQILFGLWVFTRLLIHRY